MFTAQPPPIRRNLLAPREQGYQRTSIWRVIVDIIGLLILLAITIIAHFVAKPFERGFFCSDASIQYPKRDNTVPTSAAVILSIGIPIILILITEFAKKFYFKWYPKQMSVTRLELFGTRIVHISPFVRNLYLLIVIFFYGYLATWVLTEISKNFVGGLRPHFRAVCLPTFDCSAVTSLNKFNTYLQYGADYTCQNTDNSAVREARRSFFSGHASSVFYGFAWSIMYIHVSWSWRFLGIVGHLIQVGIAILAFYIAYSRLTDYQHHWYDVLVGAIIGALIAFVTFKFIVFWNNYSRQFLPYTVSSQPSISSAYQGGYGNYRRMNPPYERGAIRYF